MHHDRDIFQQALESILREIFDGPPANEAFLLNPGDPGLLRQLESLSAEAASARPMPGNTTIAAHADHVRYGLSLLNRWSAGEPNPWADADWDASWRRPQVSKDEWRLLCEDLRREADSWQSHMAARSDWDHLAAAGSLASAAHTAYHLGAIRQILAAQG
ncbi:MAG: hypothetical protein KF861_00680 [Planctomycetaceae bacterium]|nr:hypothetical protein [Planctomycetaceae bacterium]